MNNSNNPFALRAAQRLKVQSSSWDDDLAWVGQIFPWLVVFFVGWALYTIANPTNDVVPAGRMPRLSDWLKKAPQLAGSWGNSVAEKFQPLLPMPRVF
eukprot:s687_g21.t1